jgi:hypothetical protein
MTPPIRFSRYDVSILASSAALRRLDAAPMLPSMALKSRAFLEMVLDTADAALEGARPERRVRASLAQIYFEDRHQHYEVWLRSQAGLVELGLHFEGPREENLRRVAAVADAMPLVAPALGPAVELEEWTESWTRVHETCPLMPLDEGFAAELGERLAVYVRALEPVVRPLGPMPAPVRHTHEHRRWRGRRGGPRPRAG